MHLKSLTMKGFKSFPERTRLLFAPGVSVVVGPNGSGKSNITDAVLWALGEQSPLNLRGQTMQDVIFAGSKGRAQSRAAEIELVLDNSDGRAGSEFSEISVTRRLDRSGEGEYRLNGARCRLADVADLLGGAGLGREMHSVIGQGRVEEIVGSKPRDRRLLIEEAAGLGKHRKRRRRAQLKLERTRENLDRALDVEREARSRLRPLKQQAQAADLHARIERQALELRARLAAEEARASGAELGGAEHAATAAREVLDGIDKELAEVAKRREAIEERFAERDRERREAFGGLSALRGLHERLAVRAEGLDASCRALEQGIEARDRSLAALAGEQEAGAADAKGPEPLARELEAVERALGAAVEALSRARQAGDVELRASEVGKVREGAEAAARSARRAEALLGRRRHEELEKRIAAERELLARAARLAEAVEGMRAALGERVAALEQAVGGGDEEGDAVTAELKECSRREYELQAKLRGAGERVTEAEVKAAQLRDRSAEAARELVEIGARLERELGAGAEPLPEVERAEVERQLERLARRRERLGPVNPLAQREYEEARTHVEDLEAQREDLEAALTELKGLIRETDRKIRTAFEETFAATARNFEELVEHLFPGGSGRLSVVELERPRLVLGGAEPPADGEADGEEAAAVAAEEGAEAEEAAAAAAAEGHSPADDLGVEIEVSPAGKATKRLSLLSGGEKSLVAMAFVFAVFLARPCPFYILDEVEAALDDVNIDRFLALLRRFSDRAQFIVVTHQKRTMDAADVLYGVSMGDDGISKVVSRRLPRTDGEQAQSDDLLQAA